jgi:hypothetical protein
MPEGYPNRDCSALGLAADFTQVSEMGGSVDRPLRRIFPFPRMSLSVSLGVG